MKSSHSELFCCEIIVFQKHLQRMNGGGGCVTKGSLGKSPKESLVLVISQTHKSSPKI